MRVSLTTSRVLLVFLILVFPAVQIQSQQSEAQEAYFIFDAPPRSDTFVFKLTNPQKIQEARDMINTGARRLVSGTIIKQPVYYNSPWSYHLDPKSISFPEFAIELCDASMSFIEQNLDTAYPHWCPWASGLLREIPPPPRPGLQNLPPAISMTFPHADNTHTDSAPTSVSLVANADDADGTIAKVEFNSGGIVIGETTNYPYTYTWQNLTGGSYTVSATSIDDKGARTTSKTISFFIRGGPPLLLTDAISSRAAALESVTFTKEPFQVVSQNLVGYDGRTRLILLGVNLELLPDEDVSAITAQGEDSQQRIYIFTVEAIRTIPHLSWLSQVTIKLSDDVQGIGDIWLSISLRGARSNKVPIKIR